MNMTIEILKDSAIDLIDTNLSKSIEIGQTKPRICTGPYLPIMSGNYDILSYETSDFQSFIVTGTY
jgi:hypothetical protein